MRMRADQRILKKEAIKKKKKTTKIKTENSLFIVRLTE